MCRGKFFKVAAVLFLLFSGNIYGQRYSVATNLLGYANFGTINCEFGLGLSKHFSLYMQGKYNPFTYKYDNGQKQLQNRQLSVAAGARYWPWHTYSGWFVSGQIGYRAYNSGGIFSQSTYEGDAYGVTLGAGYALMVTDRINIDFGAGVMGGLTEYVKYACPKCGKMEEGGKKLFIAPDNILVQLSFLF